MAQNKKRYGRPKKILCYDNNIVIFTGLNTNKVFYMNGEKFVNSPQMPRLGNQIGYYSLPKNIQEVVMKYYNLIWRK